MVEFHGGFNADEVPEDDVIPGGFYNVEVLNSEKKENSKGTGHALSVTFKILDDEYEGKWLFANFSLWHEKPNVRAMGKRDFARLCKAVSKLRISDSSELHGSPLVVKVEHRKFNDNIYANVTEFHKFGESPLEETVSSGDEEKPW